jgi:hypothetical protein
MGLGLRKSYVGLLNRATHQGTMNSADPSQMALVWLEISFGVLTLMVCLLSGETYQGNMSSADAL